MKASSFHKKAARGSAAVLLGLSLALPLAATPAQAIDPAQLNAATLQNLTESKLGADLLDAEGNITVFVQFKGDGAFEATQPADVRAGKREPINAQAQVQAIAQRVQSQATSAAAESGAEILYTAHNTLRGVALTGDADAIRALAQRSDVAKISRIVTKERTNAAIDLDTDTVNTWVNTGKTGKDVTIAVVDTGVDYTHSTFGGPGTIEAYETAIRSTDMPAADSGLYDPEKYVGGYDFAGDSYNGGNNPKPDANPIDCSLAGHGTHVAGTALGYGVNADGTTFDGDYKTLEADQVKGMKIGPGSAPEAKLLAFRVFGCNGGTALTGQALDRSLDPNGDGDYSDKADIVNLSLGTDFGPIDDPENAIMDALYRNGVLAVTAAGNANANLGEGDTYNILGNPANNVPSLAVANSVGSTSYADRAEILSPASIAGPVTGDYSASFGYGFVTDETKLTGEVVMTTPANPYACDPYPADVNFDGKWVFIDWADENNVFPCGSAVRFNNIQRAGGKGVVLASRVQEETNAIGGNATIPGIRLTRDDAERVRNTIAAGETVTIKLGFDMIGSVIRDTNAKDTLNPSTSRGQHGSKGFTKPDVAAPGTSIRSAAAGGGSAFATMTGTSMAAPHAAGIAALVLEANQSYSPADIKATIMNTAVHDLRDEDGDVFTVERVGSGRIDALKAVTNDVLLYNSDRKEQVSVTFGVVEVAPGDTQTLTRNFTVENLGNTARTFQVGFTGSNTLKGVTLTAPETVTVAPGGTASVPVTVTIDGSQLAKELDPSTKETHTNSSDSTEVARQYISSLSSRLTLTDGDTQLRAPVQVAPKPVSAMSVDGNIFFEPFEETANVTLKGNALNQGGYTSALGAFELGFSSPRQQTSTLGLPSAQAGDLQYVGANSNFAHQLYTDTTDQDTFVTFGISTWANWETINPAVGFVIEIDTNGDNGAEYSIVTQRIPGVDYPVAIVTATENWTRKVVEIVPINGTWGDVDTNIMDNNAMAIPLNLTKLGITKDTLDSFRYAVYTMAHGHDTLLDTTGWITYSPFVPDLAFGSDQKIGNGLFVDSPETELVAYRGTDNKAQALFLHLHNATGDLSGIKPGEDGGRAEIVNAGSYAAPKVNAPRFKDVPEGHQFHKEISWLAQRGITTGWTDGTFRPDASVNRDAMAAFFYRLAGSPQFTAPSVSPFTDVPTSHQFYKEIAWMHATGLSTGWADGTYRPNQPVNRDAMAAFFYRMAGSPEVSAVEDFADVPAGTQFHKEISWMKSTKLSTGWEDNTYRPLQPVERGAMAAFIYRYDQNILSKVR
ncbi:S8 family serine peptidase [Rothia nasimurium]|uniref:S8 family serine peptidase n=3 Tax=Rothia nasimurium TaxID=85336 RepID=UPI001F013BAB|nr:S8 family serine peptidase [Rothia nasimurium]